MAGTYRFGRRIPLPSTVQILRELLAMSASETAKERAAAENKAQGIAHKEIAARPVETVACAVRTQAVTPAILGS